MHARILIILICCATGATAQEMGDTEISVRPVAGNVYMLEGQGGNIGMCAGDDGVILVDDQYAPLTEKIVAAVRTISEKPIRFLINTHMHPDHTGGNENFGKLGTTIFGQDNVRRQMEIRQYEEMPPVVTFSEDITFHINDETVHAFKTPDAHTNGDSFIKFVNANVIHTGDVYRTTSYPYIDTGNGGSYLGTIDALGLLIEVADEGTKILPGHGVVSNVAGVRAQRDMLVVIRNRVRAAIERGMSLEEVQAAGLTAEYDSRWDSGRRIGSAAELLRAAYEDLRQ